MERSDRSVFFIAGCLGVIVVGLVALWVFA